MREIVLATRNITKRYPGVVALNRFSIDFHKGEVHALLGENGAGKSTLIKIIAGAVQADDGTIEINGKSFRKLDPLHAKNNGIEVIYQEFNLVNSLSVAENICLGERHGKFVDPAWMAKKASDVFARMGVDIDPHALISELPTSRQQLVEIAKAVSKDAKILIMDEPSAPLSVSEVDKLFQIIKTLKESGVTVIYISHRMDEIFEISDRVTVMRDGLYVDTLETAKTDRKSLIQRMVGREISDTYPVKRCDIGEVALEINGLTGNGDADVSFRLHRGEILGLAGLIGAGRTELARMIYGADKSEYGEIIVKGQRVKIHLPSDAIRHGIGLIPEDRKQQGCFLEKPIAWNATIANLRKISWGILLDRKREKEQAEHYVGLFSIKTPSIQQLVKNLSGGNQQKVVLAKTLATNSDILIFDEPTRGIDVGAKQEIYELMVKLSSEGKAILMITSDMAELLGMSDRIIVLSGGRLTGELKKEEFSQVRVLELASNLR